MYKRVTGLHEAQRTGGLQFPVLLGHRHFMDHAGLC
jgi:hypothetical protein